MAVQDGDGRPRDRADRELARGRRGRDARRARRRGRRRAHRGEVVHPIHHCVIAARERSLSRRDARGLASAGDRPVRPLPARAAPGAEQRDRALDRGRGAVGGATAERVGRARLAPRRRALRLPRAGRERRGPPGQRRPASSGSPAPARRPSRAADAKTSIVFWGVGDESPGWLVDVLARARRPRGEPHPDRVAAAAGAARALHVLRRSRRARRREPRGARRWRRCGSGSRSCAYSAPTQPRPNAWLD